MDKLWRLKAKGLVRYAGWCDKDDPLFANVRVMELRNHIVFLDKTNGKPSSQFYMPETVKVLRFMDIALGMEGLRFSS